LLKAHLGVLKTQSSMPQGLSTLFGKTKAHLMKHALDMLFWCFLKKHKACIVVLLFYFIAKTDRNHQN